MTCLQMVYFIFCCCADNSQVPRELEESLIELPRVNSSVHNVSHRSAAVTTTPDQLEQANIEQTATQFDDDVVSLDSDDLFATPYHQL